MKAELLFRLNVPCRTPQGESAFFVDKKVGHLANHLMLRTEPSGLTIVSPGFYSYFYHFDQEAADCIARGYLPLNGLNKAVVDSLYRNKVITNQTESAIIINRKVNQDLMPVHSIIEITSVCNCRCKTCYHGHTLGGITPPLSEIKQRIVRLAQLGIMLFEVSGGEPTLREDLGEILATIHSECNSSAYLVTNGEYLAELRQDLFEEFRKLRGVGISLDGIGENHDRLRLRPGLFQKILAGADRLRRENVKLCFITTINEENYSQIPDMVRLAERYEATLQLRPTIRTGEAKDEGLGNLCYKTVFSNLPASPVIRNSLVGLKKINAPASFYGCRSRSRIAVDVEGQVYSCVMDRTSKLGNLMDFSLQSLYLALEKDARRILALSKSCHDCPVNKESMICSGFCRFSHKYNEIRSGSSA